MLDRQYWFLKINTVHSNEPCPSFNMIFLVAKTKTLTLKFLINKNRNL